MTLYHATLETTNFFFDAYGVTQAEALKAMEDGWREHRRQTGASDKWVDVLDSVQVREVRTGSAWRDRERLTTDKGRRWPRITAPD
jgi:hypothetical protein